MVLFRDKRQYVPYNMKLEPNRDDSLWAWWICDTRTQTYAAQGFAPSGDAAMKAAQDWIVKNS